MVEISASILSVKREEIIKTIYNLETAKIDCFHIDVMDGDFVQNETAGIMQEYCNYITSITNVPLDVHLMVRDVRKYVDMFLPYNPNTITFHIEAMDNLYEIMDLIDYIHDNNCKVGIAINPETDANKLTDVISNINSVLVMTVKPGKGGQELISNAINKIKKIKEYIEKNGIELTISADGGINTKNSKEVVDAGAELIVVGAGLISSEDYAETVKKLRVH